MSIAIRERFNWFAPLSSIKGVGEALTQKLAKLNIYSIGDLLLHFPYRYEDQTRLMPMRDLFDGQHVLIQGSILSVKSLGKQKKATFLTIADNSGYCELAFFHTYRSHTQQWKVGTTLRCFGQVKRTHKGFQISHPDWQIINEDEDVKTPEYLTSIYPTVAGLAQKTLRKIILRALEKYLSDNIPDPLMGKLGLFNAECSCRDALRLIHQPGPEEDQHLLLSHEHLAYRRLIVEELIAHSISMKKMKEDLGKKSVKPFVLEDALLNEFLNRLPFQLTSDQQAVWQAIRADLNNTTPMLRLIQGDVGCGKTVVAALAVLAAVSMDKQVAIMVPTEILAEQHFSHFEAWFNPHNVRVALLTGKLKSKERRLVEENIALGLTKIVIGTHALFQERIQYASLALIIIDEQHRFGVHQRLALREKGDVHQLIMTATPIPRTLAMTQYAHLALSTIKSLPPGRKAIKTIALSQSRREEVIERIHSVCQKGQQVYWVCTLIEESEHLQSQAAIVTFEELSEQLRDCRVGLIHGRMEAEEKEATMQAFHRNEIQILVATTVIEVGVNVPNATLMVIENPERLGLAQLHQLRGRVGRGSEASFCVLLYQGPLSEMAQSRLSIMRESQDGFVIAEADLKLRGPGEIVGTKQTGSVNFRVADLCRDQDFIYKIPEFEETLSELPEQYVDELIKRWLTTREYIYS